MNTICFAALGKVNLNNDIYRRHNIDISSRVPLLQGNLKGLSNKNSYIEAA